MIPTRLPNWIWKSFVAGLCGTIAHSLLMLFKSRAGILPSFQPYEAFQAALSHLIGTAVPPILPWILSFINGSTIVGILFGSIYRQLPGHSGVTKGICFGVLGWALMGLVFFPTLGLGVFASKVGLGIEPALFALAMLLTYGIVMGIVYSALTSNV
jgi:hypothetical protein